MAYGRHNYSSGYLPAFILDLYRSRLTRSACEETFYREPVVGSNHRFCAINGGFAHDIVAWISGAKLATRLSGCWLYDDTLGDSFVLLPRRHCYWNDRNSAARRVAPCASQIEPVLRGIRSSFSFAHAQK